MTVKQYTEMMQRINNSFERMAEQLTIPFTTYTIPQYQQAAHAVMRDTIQSWGTSIGNQIAETVLSQPKIFTLPLSQSLAEIGTEIANTYNFAQYGTSMSNLFANTMSQSISDFAEHLSSIVIHSGYVDFPESLIPDDFEYEEVEAKKETMSDLLCSKKLSRSDALTIISMLITAIIFLITTYQNKQSDAQQQMQHQESIAVQKRQAGAAERQASATERIANAIEVSVASSTRTESQLVNESEYIQKLVESAIYLFTVQEHLENPPEDARENTQQAPPDSLQELPDSPESDSALAEPDESAFVGNR